MRQEVMIFLYKYHSTCPLLLEVQHLAMKRTPMSVLVFIHSNEIDLLKIQLISPWNFSKFIGHYQIITA